MPIRIEPRHKQRLSGSGAPGRTRRQPVNTSEVFGAPLTEEEKRLLAQRYLMRNDGGIAKKTRIF